MAFSNVVKILLNYQLHNTTSNQEILAQGGADKNVKSKHIHFIRVGKKPHLSESSTVSLFGHYDTRGKQKNSKSVGLELCANLTIYLTNKCK